MDLTSTLGLKAGIQRLDLQHRLAFEVDGRCRQERQVATHQRAIQLTEWLDTVAVLGLKPMRYGSLMKNCPVAISTHCDST